MANMLGAWTRLLWAELPEGVLEPWDVVLVISESSSSGSSVLFSEGVLDLVLVLAQVHASSWAPLTRPAAEAEGVARPMCTTVAEGWVARRTFCVRHASVAMLLVTTLTVNTGGIIRVESWTNSHSVQHHRQT